METSDMFESIMHAYPHYI